MLTHHPTITAPTCFAGLLVWDGVGWRWNGEVAEPRMSAVDSRAADFPCRTGPLMTQLVELPLRLAEFFDPLGWVLRAVQGGIFDVDLGSGAYATVGRGVTAASPYPTSYRPSSGTCGGTMIALVPLMSWMRWCLACSLVPVWDPEDHVSLEQRALALGWVSGGDTTG